MASGCVYRRGACGGGGCGGFRGGDDCGCGGRGRGGFIVEVVCVGRMDGANGHDETQ